MRTSSRLRPFALIAVAVAVLATPALLFAHARLVRSLPAADATLTSVPKSLDFWFSEKPELKFTSIQLTDSSGAQVALGAVSATPGEPTHLTVGINGSLTNGRYTVSWKTAADDGHPSSGKFSFVVSGVAPAAAAPPPPPSDTARPVSRAREPNAVVNTAPRATMSPAVRWAEFIAVLTLIGAVVVTIFVLPRAGLPAAVVSDAADRTRRLAMPVALLFAITTVWRLAAQSDLIPTATTARMSAMMTVANDTGWGRGWLIGAVGLVIVALGLALARRRPAGWVVAAIGVVVVAFSESLTGHAAASSRPALQSAVDVAHVLGAGGWLGGLTVIVLCALPAVRRAEPSGTAMSQQLVRAFHRSATECVTIVLITAVLGAWLRLNAFDDFWKTDYGSMLFRKAVFVLVLLGFGFYHWRTAVVADWTDDTRFRFKRSSAAELVVAAVVVFITALLVATALPSR